jgi:hydroxymethylpyrimidine pyrophosphatase-like HAD family hydrolase
MMTKMMLHEYQALACDYDGTIAHHGHVDDDTFNALERVRRAGKKLLLVSGRELEDLTTACHRLAIFDSLVLENGAVIVDPVSREVRRLANPPPPAFVNALRQRNVLPLHEGHVIVATWEPHEVAVLELIREMKLELQVIFNKGAVMILPSGVNKASGLKAALEDLAISPHDVVAVGDAENDHAFLAMCGCGVAVANALPTLKQQATFVTKRDHGLGVQELIEQMLSESVASL